MPLFGHDVWEGYGEIDWEKVRLGTARECLADFGISRMTLDTRKDSRRIENFRGLASVVPLAGVYHVPGAGRSDGMSGEVANVLAEIRALEDATGVSPDFLAIDFETPNPESVKKAANSEAWRRRIASNLIALVQELRAKGAPPLVLYSYKPFLQFFEKGDLLAEVADLPLWLAGYRYRDDPATPAREGWYVPTPAMLAQSEPLPEPWVGAQIPVWQFCGDGSGSAPGFADYLQGIDRNVSFLQDEEALRAALGCAPVAESRLKSLAAADARG